MQDNRTARTFDVPSADGSKREVKGCRRGPTNHLADCHDFAGPSLISSLPTNLVRPPKPASPRRPGSGGNTGNALAVPRGQASTRSGLGIFRILVSGIISDPFFPSVWCDRLGLQPRSPDAGGTFSEYSFRVASRTLSRCLMLSANCASSAPAGGFWFRTIARASRMAAAARVASPRRW
jgi:hypothetical protein